MPVAEYAKLKERFRPERFDADAIAAPAADAGMKYVNLTARHHDSFCLFRTKQTDFNSGKSPAKRDLKGELTKARHKRGLGIFYYYSYGLDYQVLGFPPGRERMRVLSRFHRPGQSQLGRGVAPGRPGWRIAGCESLRRIRDDPREPPK
jgi:hypothetical protein